MIEVLSSRAVIQITGPDSAKFLQGMVTNDIIKNTYSYNYLLTNQGKYLFDFFVYKKSEESYLLDVCKERASDLIKKLSMYKLRSNCEINDSSSNFTILYSQNNPNSGEIFSVKDPRYKKLGYRSFIEAVNINDLPETANSLYIADKYKYTIVDGHIDLEFDRSIPIEYGADELNAIDYQKGCYVGQEVISRVKYQGVIRKKIFNIEFGTEIALNLKGAKITDLQGNKIGIVCSHYSNHAIALIREENYLGLDKKIAMIDEELVDIKVPPWRA